MLGSMDQSLNDSCTNPLEMTGSGGDGRMVSSEEMG